VPIGSQRIAERKATQGRAPRGKGKGKPQGGRGGEGRKPHSHRAPHADAASDNIHSVALAARWNVPKSMRPIALERHKALSRLRGGMPSRDIRLPMFLSTSPIPPTPSGYYHPHPQPLVVAALSGRTGAGFRCLEAPRGSVAFWSGVCPSGLRVRLRDLRRRRFLVASRTPVRFGSPTVGAPATIISWLLHSGSSELPFGVSSRG